MIQGFEGWQPRVERKGGRSFSFLLAFLLPQLAAFAFRFGSESAELSVEEGLALTVTLRRKWLGRKQMVDHLEAGGKRKLVWYT